MLLAPTLLAAFLVSPSGAETVYRQSIESLTSESALVFVGVPLERNAFTAKSGHWIARERYRLKEVLKGPLSADDCATVFRLLRAEPDLEWYSDDRPRLQYCRVARSIVKEMEGKYTSSFEGQMPSSFIVGEPAGDTAEPRSLDHFYTPELQPILQYEELAGRTRRHVAWERQVQRRIHKLDRRMTMRTPRPEVEGAASILPPQLLQIGVASGVYWPVYQGRDGEPLLRWPEERNRAPARLTFESDEVAFVPVQNSQRAFANRRYAWVSVPERMRGWRASLNEGGKARTREATVTVSGHVFMAVETKEAERLAKFDWTPAAIKKDLDLTYSDRGSTKLQVVSKYFPAGATVTFPASGWTGAVVLRPPAWL